MNTVKFHKLGHVAMLYSACVLARQNPAALALTTCMYCKGEFPGCTNTEDGGMLACAACGSRLKGLPVLALRCISALPFKSIDAYLSHQPLKFDVTCAQLTHSWLEIPICGTKSTQNLLCVLSVVHARFICRRCTHSVLIRIACITGLHRRTTCTDRGASVQRLHWVQSR